MTRRRVAILISGGGTNMASLTAAMAAPDHPAEPCLVLSNRPNAAGLAKAHAAGIPSASVDHRGFGEDRAAFEDEVDRHLNEAGADLICLAGFMRVLTSGFVSRWSGRMLNIHPAILPLFPGLDTHARAIAAGMTVHGATVHEVTPELDAGPILGQAVVPILPGDSPETLAARLLPMEHRLYPAVLARYARGDRTPVTLFP